MRTGVLLLSTAAAVLAAPASAQSADPAAASDGACADEQGVGGDIGGAGQGRVYSVQDVAIARSAVNSEMVQASGSTNITSRNGLAPNVVRQTQGLVANVPMSSIRGMSASDPDP